MTETFDNQKLLIAITTDRETIGHKIIGATLESTGETLDDGHFNEDAYTIDLEPGLYVWEGTIKLAETYQIFTGEMRPARVGDLGFFGLRSLESEVAR